MLILDMFPFSFALLAAATRLRYDLEQPADRLLAGHLPGPAGRHPVELARLFIQSDPWRTRAITGALWQNQVRLTVNILGGNAILQK
jgi:hypothetical protein